jgi:hypothetical protein
MSEESRSKSSNGEVIVELVGKSGADNVLEVKGDVILVPQRVHLPFRGHDDMVLYVELCPAEPIEVVLSCKGRSHGEFLAEKCGGLVVGGDLIHRLNPRVGLSGAEWVGRYKAIARQQESVNKLVRGDGEIVQPNGAADPGELFLLEIEVDYDLVDVEQEQSRGACNSINVFFTTPVEVCELSIGAIRGDLEGDVCRFENDLKEAVC